MKITSRMMQSFMMSAVIAAFFGCVHVDEDEGDDEVAAEDSQNSEESPQRTNKQLRRTSKPQPRKQ